MPTVAQVVLAALALDAAFLTALVLVVVLFRRLAASRRAAVEQKRQLESAINDMYARLIAAEDKITQAEDKIVRLERGAHSHVNSGYLGPPPAPFYADVIDPGHTRRAPEF